MAQITTGFRAILNNPRTYDFFQDIMGAKVVRKELVKLLQPFPGCRILDIGCGTARILDHLSDVDYHGFDLSESYIKEAVRRYGTHGRFKCGLVEQAMVESTELFDIVIAAGVLHHLDDRQATGLMKLAWSALREGGRLVTFDPCFVEDQNPLARFLVSRDRGQNVRNAQEYKELSASYFRRVEGEVKHRLWIPYTHWMMQCQK